MGDVGGLACYWEKYARVDGERYNKQGMKETEHCRGKRNVEKGGEDGEAMSKKNSVGGWEERMEAWSK